MIIVISYVYSVDIEHKSHHPTAAGWIEPERGVAYPVYGRAIVKIKTDSIFGSDDKVHLKLYTNSNAKGITDMTDITWNFKDWSYHIYEPNGRFLKFTAEPPAAINKTWEVTKTTIYLKIKCNGVEVIHFTFDKEDSISKFPDAHVAEVIFSRNDTATKTFYYPDG